MSSNTILEAVIDAGSSGTRIFLYEVIPGDYPLVTLLSESEFSVTPSGKKEDGLNNYIIPRYPDLMQEACDDVIKPLLDNIRNTIQERDINPQTVIVNLFATAGMRYTQKHFGAEIVEHFYQVVKNYIKQSGFTAGEIRTCNGNHEEGLWTWINLNDTHRDIFRSQNPPLGVIEVGGSSAQLSFPILNCKPDDDIIHSVKINNKEFIVYCKTYLGLGQDDARKKMRSDLGPINSSACFPKGLPQSMDHGDILDGVGELKLGADGNHHHETCWNYYDNLLAHLSTNNPLPKVKDIDVDFVGIDGIYHALKYWQIEDCPSDLNDIVKTRIGNYETFDGILHNEYVQAQTANATYISALLYGPNGLFNDNPKKITSALPNKTDKGRLLTWTRGFLLVKYAS